jgi:hypothetical protein
MDDRIFFPISSKDFDTGLKPGQRYRHPFGDLRLARRHDDLLERLSEKGTSVIHRLSPSRKDIVAAYRFVDNDRVGLAELICQTSRIEESQIRGKDLQVNLDRSSFSLKLGGRSREGWAEEVGVLEDNRTPGFYLMPSLVLERDTQHCIGLGDVVLHTRPKSTLGPKEKVKARVRRAGLPLEHRETGAWAIAACNTALQLQAAERVTFVMDQGGDCYEVWQQILDEAGGDFICRVKNDREATLLADGSSGRFTELLASLPWSDVRTVPIRALGHYSKTSGKWVQRKKREAKLAIRFAEVDLSRPSSLAGHLPSIRRPLTLVEVAEMGETVPEGEEPIRWLLLTSWEVGDVQTAWEVVGAYQGRWHIEQLFRCCKKQGLDAESSQLRDPESIIKLTVMSLKVSAEALRLTQVRDGEEFVPIDTMFSERQRKFLGMLNAKLSGHTEKVTNPHRPDSLAWAAWVIARLGHWKGYASQHKPGPVTMARGLVKFYDLAFWMEDAFDP